MDKQDQQALRELVGLLSRELRGQQGLLVRLALAGPAEQRETLARLAESELRVLQEIRGLAVLMGQRERVV
jgi:hypothetical protein